MFLDVPLADMFQGVPLVDMFRGVHFGASAKKDKQDKEDNNGPHISGTG
jgi:hypothetical protein